MKRRIAKKIVARMASQGYAGRRSYSAVQLRNALNELGGPAATLSFDLAQDVNRCAAKLFDRQHKDAFLVTVESASALKAIAMATGFSRT